MQSFINQSVLLKKTNLLAVLLAVLLFPQELLAQTLSKTYTFTGATPNLRYEGNNVYYPPGGTLECDGVTTWDAPGDDESGGCKFDYKRQFLVKKDNGLLVSRDKFHKVSKIIIGITAHGGDRWSRFSFIDEQTQTEVSSLAEGEGDKNIVLNLGNLPTNNQTQPVTVDGVLTIHVQTSEAYVYCFTLNSITVEYERTNPGLFFWSDSGAVTEWSLNWSDCVNNNAFIPPLKTSSGEDASGLASFTSTDENVVTIDGDGVYSLIGPGQSTITATFNGDTQYEPESLSYTLTIIDDRTDPTLYYSSTTAEVTYGSEFTAPTLKNLNQLSDITYSSSTESVATIDENGVVTLVSPGVTTISASFAGDNYYKPKTASYVLTYHAKALSLCRAELNPESREYNGGYQSTVMYVYDGDTPLVNGRDFSVSQSNNMVNVGSYTITATAIENGNYSGQLTATYTITPVSLADAVITLTPTSSVYNGTAQKPTVSVAFMNPKTNELETPLIEGTDYTVSYSNNTNVTDNATVTITGKGNYTGTNSTKFTINKAAGSITYATASVTKTFGDAAFTNALTKTGDGTVAYTSSKTAVATVNASTGAVTIVGNGTATITATVTDGTNYTYATKTATYSLTVNTATMNVTASGYTGTYDGKAHGITVSAPEGATVKYGTTSGTYNLTAAPTYTNAGTYTVYYQVTKTGYTTVTGNKTVTIGKAAPIVVAPTAKKLQYTGQAQELVGAGSATGGTMLYSLDGKNYSEAIPTGTAAQEYTIYFKVVGDDNHIDVEATSVITIIVDDSTKYDLWIGDTQVTEKNCKDILGDSSADQGKAGSFQYIPNLNKLFITNNTNGLKIETKNNKGLTVYLAPKSTNAVGSIVYTGSGNAPLTITTDGNYPGTITMSSNANVISGFSSLTLEQNLLIMNPEGITYDGNNKKLETKSATIGTPLSPITEEKTIKPDGNELKPEAGSDDVNKVVDDILYTLGNANNSNGDGYDDDGFVVINTVTADQTVVKVTQAYTPGTDEYLEGFKGLTFMVPAGKGEIEFDIQTQEGYVLKVVVGDSAPYIVKKTEKGFAKVPYNVSKPTYVYAYASKANDANSARGIQKGKKTTVHIKIYSIKITSSKSKQSNSAAQASNGQYQGDTSGLKGQGMESEADIEASRGDVNGDEAVNAADIVEIVNAIMGKHSTMFDERAADSNGDDTVNAADIVQIVNMIMGK